MFYITGFKPFKGREKNGSQTLVEALAQEPSLSHVSFEILDVTWKSFDDFYKKIMHSNLSGVIGFGEGKEGAIAVELAGKNLASGVDESGISREDCAISTSGPKINHSRIQIPERADIEESHDAGEFLCNYELFHINQLKTTTSAFVHLPPQGDTSDEEYLARLKPAVLELLSFNSAGRAPASSLDQRTC